MTALSKVKYNNSIWASMLSYDSDVESESSRSLGEDPEQLPRRNMV